MRGRALYATLEELQLKTGRDENLERYRRFLHDASRVIDQYTRRWFAPYQETRTYDARGSHIDAYRLRLDAGLLEVTTLTNGDSTTISASDYVLRPSNITPAHTLALTRTTNSTWTFSTNWENAISVNGVWGYHEDYTNAWVDTLDTVQDNPLSASATTLNVADGDGIDERYRTRFQVGMILKIESEYLQVMAVNANALTVLRGQLGSTAASHVQTTAISSWAVQGDIEKATIDLATFFENNRDQGGTIMFANADTIIEQEAPRQVRDALMHYGRARMWTL